MRITGGGLKGRKISDKELKLRPTTNKAKQGLFNILNNRLQWDLCNSLDLFSGTGSLAFEMASRGSRQVTAVDINPKNCHNIRDIAKQLGLNNVISIRSDALSFLRSHSDPYDVIICDPPYDYPHYSVIPELVFGRRLLKNNGWLVIEHSKRTTFKDMPNFAEQRAYGDVNFSFFYNPGEE